jgi:polysaccharide export outer membrane protein
VESTSQNPSRSPASDEYRLGPGDHLAVEVPFADEINNNKTIAVGTAGEINLAFAGRIHAAGLTTTELEQEIGVKLRPYFESPQVTVNVVDYGSRLVAVWGAVRNPGVHKLQGKTSLIQVLSASGGLTQDAGSKLNIVRQTLSGPLPLPDAVPDSSGTSATAQVDLAALLAGNAAQNILVSADDIISVPQAKLIFVMGEVHKPGGFPLQDTESPSVLRALALAEGPTRTAHTEEARILRVSEGGPRKEIVVNLTKVLDRKETDIPMQAEDILYIPNNKAKSAALRGIEAAIQIGTGVVVWGRY